MLRSIIRSNLQLSVVQALNADMGSQNDRGTLQLLATKNLKIKTAFPEAGFVKRRNSTSIVCSLPSRWAGWMTVFDPCHEAPAITGNISVARSIWLSLLPEQTVAVRLCFRSAMVGAMLHAIPLHGQDQLPRDIFNSMHSLSLPSLCSALSRPCRQTLHGDG